MAHPAPQAPVMIDISDLISMAAPQSRNMVNDNWLRSCFSIVYGTTNVFINNNEIDITIDKPLPCATMEDALQALGTPDLLTWGCWMATSRYIEEHSRDIVEQSCNAFATAQMTVNPPVWNSVMVSAA